MWKKGEDEGTPTELGQSQRSELRPQPSSQPARIESVTATIGPSIIVKGDVTGEEDLLVQGTIEGTVSLKKNRVMIGPDGRAKANITGRVVIVEGEVEGDLQGQEQVVLKRTARVQGNINAPRVTLEDGATFRGSIEMDVAGGQRRGPGQASDGGIVTPGKGAEQPTATDKKA